MKTIIGWKSYSCHWNGKGTVMVVKDDVFEPAISQSAISKSLSAKTNST